MDFKSFKAKYQKVLVNEYANSVNIKPLVSVCVQTYQHANYIKECLDSILCQSTNFDFEIILGDDESVDGTTEICLEYAKKYPNKIRFLAHKRKNNIAINEKPSGRFNMLYNLYSANGKYSAFCEGDDYWTDPLKLQKQVDFLESNPEYVIHSGGAQIIRNGILTKETIGLEIENETFKLEKFYSQNNLVTCTVMFLNNITYSDKTFTKVTFGDWYLYATLLHCTGKKAYRSTNCFSVYRIHNLGVMESLTKLKRYTQTIHQIICLKKDIGYTKYSQKEVLKLNTCFYEKFKIELKAKHYFKAFKTFISNYNQCKFETPFKKYISCVKRFFIN